MDMIIVCACLPILYSLLRAEFRKRRMVRKDEYPKLPKEINRRNGNELKTFVSRPLAYTSNPQDNPQLLGGEPYQVMAWPDFDQPAEHSVHARYEQRGVSTSNFV